MAKENENPEVEEQRVQAETDDTVELKEQVKTEQDASAEQIEDVQKEQEPKKPSFANKVADFIDRSLRSVFDTYFDFFDGKYVSKMKNMEVGIKVALVGFGVSMFLNIFLANAVVNASQDKVVKVVVPEDIIPGHYMVGKGKASGSYFELIASGFVATMGSYSYLDYEEKIQRASKFILPRVYSKAFADIKKNAQFVIDEKVSQKFNVQNIETRVKGDRAQVVLKGLLDRSVGSTPVAENKPYQVEVIVRMIEYTPYVESFNFDYKGIVKRATESKIALERNAELERKRIAEEKKKEERKVSSRKKREEEKKKKDEF